MVSKEILAQYNDLVEEIKETRQKIDKLADEISKLQKRISDIESGEKVKDKVRGGEGGLQNFTIEGCPLPEYEKIKSRLMMKKLLLSQRQSTLELLEFDLLGKTNEVEQFLTTITDSRMRRIINLRFIDGLSWNSVADKIGGGNTEDSIRMAFNRFMEK